ncbi:MAG TPA: PRC-barrel domain-containing protein [Candidatus Bathyarchaeia archaeon]|nr:PRC-barrel domain-containing protein [Candidatus Bathyarchaeia archaeon]
MATRLEFDRKLVKADEFKGKKVIDREGIEYGKVKHVHINSDTLEVVGITVHEGINKNYFLSRDYVDRFTEESVLLSSAPIRTDVAVVDIDGRKIGKVKRLNMSTETNDLESIEVTEGLTGSRIFHISEIWGVGEKIILRQTRDEYKRP